MKNILPLLFGAVLLPLAANAQSYSNVVGYVTLGNPAGPSVPANTDNVISIPLLNPTEAVATVDSVAGSDINLQGTPGYTANEWVGYYALITSGTNEGQIVLVTANDADTLTVSAQPGDSLTGIANGDGVSLSPAWTLDTYLGALPTNTQLLAFSGTATGQNVAADEIYAYDLTFGGWYDTVTFMPAGGTILYPGEGYILRAGASPVTSLVVAGEVSTAKHRLIIPGGAGSQDTRMGYISPVDEVIINASIPAATNDQILVFDNTITGQNKAAAAVYAYDLTFGGWYDTVTFSALTTESFTGGSSFVYRTAGAAADVVWTDEQSYYGTL